MKKYPKGFVPISNYLDIPNDFVTCLLCKYKRLNRLALIIAFSLISNFSYGEIYIKDQAMSDQTSVYRNTNLITIKGGKSNQLTVNPRVKVNYIQIGEEYTQTILTQFDNFGKIGEPNNRWGSLTNGGNKYSGSITTLNNHLGANITYLVNNKESVIGTINNDHDAVINKIEDRDSSSIEVINNKSGGRINDLINLKANFIKTINNDSDGFISSILNYHSSFIGALENSGRILSKLYNSDNSKIKYINNKKNGHINEINNISSSFIETINNHPGAQLGTVRNNELSTIKAINNYSGAHLTTIQNLRESKIGLLQNSGTISTTGETTIKTEGELTLINTGIIKGWINAIESSGYLNLTQNKGGSIIGGTKGAITTSGDKDNIIKILGGEVKGSIKFNSIGINNYEQANSTVDGDISLTSGKTNSSSLTHAKIDGTFAFNGKLSVNGQSNINSFELKDGSTLSLGALPADGEAYISSINSNIGAGINIRVIKPSDFTYNKAIKVIEATNDFNLDPNNYRGNSPLSDFTLSSATGTKVVTLTKTKKAKIEVAGSDENLEGLMLLAKEQLQNNPELADGLAVIPADQHAKALTTLLSTTSATSSKGAVIAASNAEKNIKQHLNGNSIGFANNTGISTGDTGNSSSFWTQGFASNTEQKDLGLIEGYSLNSYGFSLGYDHRYLNDDNLLGAAFSYSDTKVKLSDLGNSKTDIGSYQLGIYYSHKLAKSSNNLFKNIYFNLLGSYSYNQNRSTRELVVGSFKKSAEADFISHGFGLYSELGFKKRLNESWTISPSASLSFAHLRTPTYSESGAGSFNLSVSQENSDSLILGLGITAQKELQLLEQSKDENVSDEFRTKVSDELLDDCFVTSSNFEGGDQIITEGASAKRMAIEAGVGIISLNASKNLELRADYNFKYRDSNKTSSIYATAKYKF